jgi:hypothetical protein
MPLDSQLTSVRCRSTLSASSGLGTASYPVDIVDDLTYTNGTGAGQCDLATSFTLSIATGATSNIDLIGAINSALGVALNFVKLKVLYIKSRNTNTTNVTVSRPAANGAALFGAASGALAPIEPGGRVLWESPGAAGLGGLVAGTADLIAVTNAAGATALVDVYVAGTSA